MSDKIWKIRINRIDKRQGILIRQLRVFSLAIRRFRQDNCLTAASALTFYTLFSIVPVLALAFAIAKGFGYEKTLQADLLENYSEYSEVLTKSFEYANSMLSNTKEGVIAGIGVVLLLWSVMKLLVNMELTFNQIWEVKRGRSWVRRLTDYLTIMLMGPLFVIVSAGLTVALEAKVGDMRFLSGVAEFFLKMLAYALVGGIFTFIYMALPNTKVKPWPAIISALVSTVVFELLSWAYVKFQIGVNSMNAIYGGFAALPLFLIWVQYCWYIVLFGAELAYSYQNVDHYELNDEIKNMSMRFQKVVALMIANLVAKRFYNAEPLPAINEINERLDLPSRLTRILINDMVESGILVEIRSESRKDIVYQPGATESKFTVQFVIDALEKNGVNELPISDAGELRHINTLMQEFGKTMDTDLGQVYVKDIVK